MRTQESGEPEARDIASGVNEGDFFTLRPPGKFVPETGMDILLGFGPRGHVWSKSVKSDKIKQLTAAAACGTATAQLASSFQMPEPRGGPQ